MAESSIACELWTAAGGNPAFLKNLEITGSGSLPSVFPVSDLASAAVGCAALAIAELIAARFGVAPKVQVDRRFASIWFGLSVRPLGWRLPALWDALSADYEAKDGWIRLHMNAPHHRDAALAVLGVAPEKEAVVRQVSDWAANDLETAVVMRGGCAATMRSIPDWKAHPQGQAVAGESLLENRIGELRPKRDWKASRRRPLDGLRVLDLTRVLAGPVATRFLAAFGAEVLRIDPPMVGRASRCVGSRLRKRLCTHGSARGFKPRGF